MSEIIASGIVQKHMMILVQGSSAQMLKKSSVGPFEMAASITATKYDFTPKNEERKPNNGKPPISVSARETLRKKKEEESKKKFDEIKNATKAAYIQIAMYFLYLGKI